MMLRLSAGVLLLVAMLPWISLRACAAAGVHYNACLTNYSVLEQAVLDIGDNRYNIIKAFYSPISSYPSVYVKVKYVSVENDTVKGTWLWTRVPIYLIFPPIIFQYTSLIFNHHSISKQVQDDLTIQLPAACCNTSTIVCRNGGENMSIVNNHYLDVLTNELYLYAQYNGKNARVVFDDEPSTSRRYDCDTIQSQKMSFHLFSGFCLLLPFGLLLLFMILVHTCRPKIRRLFTQTSPTSSINPNYAALILTGIVFSFYVLICDALAVSTLNSEDKSDIYHSDRPFYIILIFFIDSSFVLIAVLNIVFLACNKQRSKCMMRCVGCFVWICFWRRLNYHKIDGHDQFNYTSSKTNSNKTDEERNCRENNLHQEKKLLLLLISFAAPLVCMGTHASFVLMAWSSDSDQASSMTVVFILSFIYYFLGFRQLYILFVSGPFIQKSKHKPIIEVEVEKKNYFVSTPPCKYDFSSSLRISSTSQTTSRAKLQRTASDTDLDLCSHTEWTYIKGKPKIHRDQIYRYTCVPLADEEETAGPSKDFNFIVLLCELFLATLFMAVIEGLTIMVYFLLPAPVSTVPSDILSILHLALLIGGGLVAYKLLTFQTPTEQILLKSVLDSYNPVATNQNSSEDVAKRVGKILGNLLKKLETKKED